MSMNASYPSPTVNGSSNSSGGMLQDHGQPRAHQACMSCRKQKRKCSKALPACALCERMNRHCDYTDNSPQPTAEDFNRMRSQLIELEARLNGEYQQRTPYSPGPSTTADSLVPQITAYTQAQAPPQDTSWQVLNRFPAISFLDSETFQYGGIAVPKPAVDIPADALQILGDGPAIGATIMEYFATVHQWMPIVSHKRLTRNLANPMWEAGPDLALLFLCMKLIISRPQDGVESSHSHIYTSAKRFVALMEAAGSVSLLVLQASLLITWFEYGQAIYPAAYMSAGWCVRYGNMLGINGSSEATPLLGRPGTWTEQEERRRTWWGVLLADRVVSIGSQGYLLNSQEPDKDSLLPVKDAAWDSGEITAADHRTIENPIEDHVAPFPRLCQAYIMMGKVFFHHFGKKESLETAKYGLAQQLHSEISALSRVIQNEASTSTDYISLAAALALSYSAQCALLEKYSCAGNGKAPTTEGAAMQAQAVQGLKTVSDHISEFLTQLMTVSPSAQDLDRISPIVMDALYSAASNYAWMVRESGDERSQMALDLIRHSLGRLGGRWRNAAEYLRILEAQEFTYAVGSAGSS